MLLLKNNLKGIFSLFIFFPLFLFGRDYFSIYNAKQSKFAFYIEKGNYKVVVVDAPKIDYYSYAGFKFFIPDFTQSFSLQVLRFNSVGYINGYLAKSPYLNSNQIIADNPNNLKYYFTDYNTDNRQLDYLLNGKIMLYPNVTSLAIEAYHIPLKKKLNTPLYFTFLHNKKKNNLKYLVYSYSMILNKKKVDEYVKKYFKIKNYKDRKFDYLYTYILNLHNKPQIKVSKKTQKKSEKKKKKVVFRLDTKRIFYLQDFPIKPNRFDTKNVELEMLTLKSDIQDINYSIHDLENYLIKKLNTKVLLFPKDVLHFIDTYFESMQKIDKLFPLVQKIYRKRYKPKCFFDNNNIDKQCFNNSDYFYKYVYYLGFENKLPTPEEILGFGDYKSFNKIAITYYHLGDFDKAKLYLFKAYALAPIEDRGVIAHNLASLYYLNGAYEKDVPKEVVKYLKESSLAMDIFNLGVCYYIGYGVEESDFIARKYFEEASKMGIKKATKNLEIMKKFKIGLKK